MRNRIKRIINSVLRLFHRPPADTGVVTAEAVAWAIEAANKTRAANGAEKLDSEKLPYSAFVGDSERCVLAKLFNFACKVRPRATFTSVLDVREGEGWVVEMRGHREAADTLARALGTQVKHLGAGHLSHVELPQAVARIAVAFDARELSDEFVVTH